MTDSTMAWMQSYADYIRSTGVALPVGWLPYSWDSSERVCPRGFVKVTGSVPIGKKRDGSPRWPARKHGESHFVETSKYEAYMKQDAKR